MAPEIEISAAEAESVRQLVEKGIAELVKETTDAVGLVSVYRVDGEELRLNRVWHFDDKIDDHLRASDNLMVRLIEDGIIGPRELQLIKAKDRR